MAHPVDKQVVNSPDTLNYQHPEKEYLYRKGII